jgi:hypothetical protein
VTSLVYWSAREDLSRANKLRRSYYEILRDDLDQFLLQYTLIDSYNQFLSKTIPYPFVEMRELKPRARIPDIEYESQNSFLILFVEDSIPACHKKYIRFFDVNKTTKANLLRSKTISLAGNFDRNQKFFDSAHFINFLKLLLPVDYALLIQRDPGTRATDRYCLSHYHVRIDCPISDAAEDLSRYLRYVSKDLYEKGDQYAENMQKKFFEYFGMQVMAGGRRTAAIVAAQYLKKLGCITTVYAGSSESRALIRLSERGVSKSVLIKLKKDEVDQVASTHNLLPRTFRKNYQVAHNKKDGIFIFHATYTYTDYARPPDDGKLRDIKPDLNWLSVGGQHILPKPGVWKYPPLSINIIYS